MLSVLPITIFTTTVIIATFPLLCAYYFSFILLLLLHIYISLLILVLSPFYYWLFIPFLSITTYLILVSSYAHLTTKGLSHFILSIDYLMGDRVCIDSICVSFLVGPVHISYFTLSVFNCLFFSPSFVHLIFLFVLLSFPLSSAINLHPSPHSLMDVISAICLLSPTY